MSLLQFILNQNSSDVYGANKNYNIGDISVQGALERSAAASFETQAFQNNGIGFKAFVLAYDNQGLNIATTGYENPTSTAEDAPPTSGLLGFRSSIPDTGGTEETDEAIQALSQINYLNDVRMKVWIPILNKDINIPQIKQTESGVDIVDRQLYETCAVEGENLLQKLPPPGSLVVVDYENRRTREGLTLKQTICSDANFTRIILSELAGTPLDVESLTSLFSGLASTNDFFNFANGDALAAVTPPATAQTSEEIQEAADNYDDDTTLPNKSQHEPFLAVAHPDFLPHMKAFMFNAWNDSQVTIQINQVYRTPERSAEMIAEYERGERSIKPSPTSYHLYGMAIDFNPTLRNGAVLGGDSPATTWQSSGVVTAGERANLNWGGRFASNYDPIHFDFQNVAPSTGELKSLVLAFNAEPNKVNIG